MTAASCPAAWPRARGASPSRRRASGLPGCRGSRHRDTGRRTGRAEKGTASCGHVDPPTFRGSRTWGPWTFQQELKRRTCGDVLASNPSPADAVWAGPPVRARRDARKSHHCSWSLVTGRRGRERHGGERASPCRGGRAPTCRLTYKIYYLSVF